MSLRLDLGATLGRQKLVAPYASVPKFCDTKRVDLTAAKLSVAIRAHTQMH